MLGQRNANNSICFILVPPKWIDKFPESIDVPVGNSFELVCNATGSPQPIIEWFQNSTRITTK